MKKIILGMSLTLITFASMAAEYRCTSPFYDIDLGLDGISTHIWVRDHFSHELLHQGYTTWEKKEANRTVYYFYPQYGDETMIYVKNEVIEKEPNKMSVFVSGAFTMMPINENMKCNKW